MPQRSLARLHPDDLKEIIEGLYRRLSAAPMPEGRLLTTRDAMRILGYTNRSAFYTAVKRDRIPVIRINPRVLRFEQAQLERWAKGAR